MKKNIETLKNAIKALVANQIATKNQRKTVNLVGERTMEPCHAAYAVINNKFSLHAHYQVYATIRGKEGTHGKTIDNHYYKQLLTKYQDGGHCEETVCGIA